MTTKLTEKEIKSLLSKEEDSKNNPYKDEGDLMMDLVFNLYEKKEIDENLFKALTSTVMLHITGDTISGMTDNLVKNNLNILNTEESNKIFLLNYSKKSYA